MTWLLTRAGRAPSGGIHPGTFCRADSLRRFHP